MKQVGRPPSRHFKCSLPHGLRGPTGMSRQAQVTATRGSAPPIQSQQSKSQSKYGHGFVGGVVAQVAAGLPLPAPCTAATLFAQREPAGWEVFGSHSFKISPGHSSFPLRLKGLVSEPWHRSSVSCSLPVPSCLSQPSLTCTA